MRKPCLLIFALVSMLCLPIAAQNRNNRQPAKPQQPAAPVETPAQRMFKSMLSSTAKIMFIDSVVVDKADFIKHVPLNKESGTLSTYEEHFKKPAQVPLAVFTNEFGDRCYYSEGDTLGTRLYSIDRLGEKWSKPRQLAEFGNDYRNPNYPFLMSDGITLFFSAKGEHSLGGYDIFMTLFDADNGTFYKPENYGLPFNSTANDYMVAFDELDELGWLVTDRYQPAGKVCIYTFVPTFPRASFDQDDYSDAQIERFARIRSIQETWRFGDRPQALARYQGMLQRSEDGNAQRAFSFVINDDVVYHSVRDFKSPTTRELFKSLQELNSSLAEDEQTIEMQRDRYYNANARTQKMLNSEILNLEKQIEDKRRDARQIEKEIRRTENLLLD